jgi:hypothetical protein
LAAPLSGRRVAFSCDDRHMKMPPGGMAGKLPALPWGRSQ